MASFRMGGALGHSFGAIKESITINNRLLRDTNRIIQRTHFWIYSNKELSLTKESIK